MRICLALIVVIIGSQIGLAAINKVQDLQDQRMQKLCKVDATYCM